MNVLPAIDVLDGKAVRLRKGQRDTAEVVGDPVELAKRFKAVGAPMVHLVDLEAVFGTGRCPTGLVRAISEVIPVQVGGGVRSGEHLHDFLCEGASRIVVGTWAFKNPDEFLAAVASYQDFVVVAADVTVDGKVAVSGWAETHPMEIVPAV